MADYNMNTNGGANARPDSDEQMQMFTMRDIIDMMLEKWYWFVVSLIVCGALGVFYIARTPRIYQRQATILVKDSRKGVADMSAFSDLLGMSGRRNVDNELYVLQSRRLMMEVVRRLGLTTRYTVKEGLRSEDLYRRSPIDAELIDPFSEFSCSFRVTTSGDERITLSHFSNRDLDRADRKASFEACYGDTVCTPIGKIVVERTPFFTEEYADRKITVYKSSEAVMATKYRKATESAVANKQASIITISLKDRVARRAEDVINTLIQVYNDDAVNDKREMSAVTAEFIDDRLAIIGTELGAVDEDIETFKRRNELFDLKTDAQQIMTESSKFKVEKLGIENQMRIAEFTRDYLLENRNRSSLIPSTTTFSGNSGNALNARIDDYNTMILRREKLIANSSEHSPVIKDMDNNLAAVRNAILASLESHISALQIELAAVSREQQRTDSRISAAPSQEKEYLSIARQQRIKEELYLYLLNKREENALSIAIAESNARIVDHAFGAARPVHPRTMMILLISLVLGAAIPFAIIYAKASLDTTISGRKDLEKALSIPYLGDIPVSEGSMPKSGVVVRENGRDSISEAFRILRTNINFMFVGNNSPRVIQLTSSNPGAGKTFVSTNLAVTLAMSGRKVLLIDLDLRRRTMSKQLGHRSDPDGLSAYMAGTETDLAKIIRRSGIHDNLDLMFAGLQPPNPAEMLMSERMDELFATLRSMYDYILLDTVPAMAVADAMITNRLADVCLYVVREGVLDRRQLPDIENMYREKKLDHMCIVLNGATFSKRGYGYGYGYGYGLHDDEKKGFAAKIKSIFKRNSEMHRYHS